MPIKPENRALYPKNWKAIRDEILVRADFVCECLGECGGKHAPPALQEELYRGSGYYRCQRHHMRAYNDVVCILTIAHLNHNPKDSRRRNLKAMCQGCHLRYDKDHHQKNAAATRERRRQEAEREGRTTCERP